MFYALPFILLWTALCAALNEKTGRNVYQIHQRTVLTPVHRDAEKLTFSGDIAKIIALANAKGLAEENAAQNKSEGVTILPTATSEPVSSPSNGNNGVNEPATTTTPAFSPSEGHPIPDHGTSMSPNGDYSGQVSPTPSEPTGTDGSSPGNSAITFPVASPSAESPTTSEASVPKDSQQNSAISVMPTVAYITTPGATPRTPSLAPTAKLDSLISCKDMSLQRPEFVYFTYSLETQPNVSDTLNSVWFSSEESMTKDVANLLLPCYARRSQAGSADLGFQGIDHIPEDSISTTIKCNSTVNGENDCTVFDGVISIYISNGTDIGLATYYTLTAIREVLGLIGDQVDGVVKGEYIGPDIVNPSAFGGSQEIGTNGIANKSDNLNPTLVLFAVGGCAFATSVGLIYYLRRNNRNSSGDATQAAGTDQQDSSRDGVDRPLSPFSEMLPRAYRFDQDGNMSAILELDDESATQRSGIVMSDSGFTTEEDGSVAISSFDAISAMNRSDSPVLGARKRPEDDPSLEDSSLLLDLI